MARESLPATDFRVVYAAGALAHDAMAAAFVSEVWTAEIGAGQRRVASVAEAIAGHGSAAAGIARSRGGRRGYACSRREAAAGAGGARVRGARNVFAGGFGGGGGAARGG